MPLDVTSITPIKVEHRAVVDPWSYLQSRGRVRMHYVEFRLLNQLGMILRGKEQSPLSRVARNAAALAGLALRRDRVLILGAEPFRMAALLLPALKARHRCIFHGSWPWDAEDFRHGALTAWRKRSWMRFFKDTECVCVTQEAADALAAYGARAHVIPWSIDCEAFTPATEPRRPGPVRVLFVGELRELKGLRLILDVMRNPPSDDITFLVAGRGPFQNDIERLQREGRPVEYLGFVGDRAKLADLMRACDMLILPSIRIGNQEEKFGMVLVEAMACAKPVIASDCLGPRRIIESGRTGLLIPQNDAGALREAIGRLAADPELRARLGAEGRRAAVERYDKKRAAEQWMQVFERAVRPRTTD